jgi:MFS family permease
MQRQTLRTLALDQRKPALISAWLGQAFDAMNTMMFFIIMFPALCDLLHTRDATRVGWYSGIIIAVFTIGWAAGSVLFGVLADRFGRAKTMAGSILLYAIASGLCAFSTHWWDLAIYRFLVGVGIGGECSLGAVLISECWPREKKLWAICVMNTSWPVGAALTGVFNLGTAALGWRFLFALGVLPALVTFYIRANIKETDAFLDMNAKRQSPELRTKEPGFDKHPLTAIFDKQYIHFTVLSAILIAACTAGYYASIAWMPAWINQLTGELSVQERSDASLYQSLGCLLACLLPIPLVRHWGYKGALVVGFLGSFLIPFFMFAFLHQYDPALIAACSVGIGLFTPIPWIIMYTYLPEMYPTQLLGTGAGFAWAVGRLVTAALGLCAGPIIALFHGSYGFAAATFSLAYLVGVIAALFVRRQTIAASMSVSDSAESYG